MSQSHCAGFVGSLKPFGHLQPSKARIQKALLHIDQIGRFGFSRALSGTSLVEFKGRHVRFPFQENSALETAPLAWTDTRRAFAKNDAPFGQVIRCHFDMNPIAHDGPDTEFPHLARRVSDNPVIIFQHDAKAPIWINLVDLALEGQKILFGHMIRLPKD